MNVKILVCSHKNVEIPRNDCFMPIQVGSELTDEDFGFVQDNTGYNISKKNRNYCELTAHYWAWKNLKNVDIIGLNHYRRFFDFGKRLSWLSPEFSFVDSNSFYEDYDLPDTELQLKKYDIILPSKSHHPILNTKQYCLYHLSNDWEILRDVINEVSPEYSEAFVLTMDKRNCMSDFNMFITSWKIFNKYSEWLFRILFETEKRIHISQYVDQARVFGFMSERLMNVFCEKEKLRIHYVPTIMPIDKLMPWMNTSRFSFNVRKIRYYIAFRLGY